MSEEIIQVNVVFSEQVVVNVSFPDPIITVVEIKDMPTFSNTFKIGSTLLLGDKARLVALSNGFAFEVLNSSDVWVRQSEQTES